MRNLILILFLACPIAVWAQDSNSPSKPTQAPDSNRPTDAAGKPHPPDLTPPRSDRVNAEALEPGESSSKDEQVDLSPPPGDDKAHPDSSSALEDATGPSPGGDTSEFHPWDPHKAAKNVEVGDFYFKRKNYKAAEDRYREALYYKNNDAIATLRLAICLEKLNRPSEAREEYEAYLKILPFGPESEQAHKALDRLKDTAASTKPTR